MVHTMQVLKARAIFPAGDITGVRRTLGGSLVSISSAADSSEAPLETFFLDLRSATILKFQI